MQKLLSRSQAAEYLGVSVSTLARWAMLREGPDFVRIGGRVRYPLAMLDDYIDSCKVTTVVRRGVR